MNGLTVRLWLSIMISPSLSLHHFRRQWTKHWCIYFVYKIHYTCMIMCAIFTWVHTGQPNLNVVFHCLFWQQHKITVWESENAVILPEIQRISLFHSTETFKSGQISIENIPTAILFPRSINLNKSRLVGTGWSSRTACTHG